MLQGKTVLENFDIAKGRRQKRWQSSCVSSKASRSVADLRVRAPFDMRDSKAPPALCGVEFTAE
jgi:hypothetical protein